VILEMSSVSIEFGKGNWDKIIYLAFMAFVVYLCSILARPISLGIGVSPADYIKNEIFYSTSSMLLGFLISQYVIRKHIKEQRKNHRRGAI
jgi:hypothetical protein